MAESEVAISPVDVGHRKGWVRLRRWFGSNRIFPLIPFLLVECLFILTVFAPFVLTVWISLLK
jgi:hypothetical protein